MKPTFAFRSLLLGSTLLAATTAIHAETYYWDSNNDTIGFGDTDGTWAAPTPGATTSGWTIDATGNTSLTDPASSVTTGTSDTVNFGTATLTYGTTGKTITVSGAQNVGSMVWGAAQSSTVKLATTVGTNYITLAAAGSINVNGGNHILEGTGTSSSGLSRDLVFTTTGASFDIASGSSFEIKGRVGGGNTSATYSKTGAGTLILSGQNGSGSAWAFNAGLFTISNGAVRFANTNATGNSGNKYSVTSGAAFELDGGFNYNLSAGTITLNGTGIGSTGAIRSRNGNNSFVTTTTAGSIVLAEDSSIGVDADALTVIQVISGSGKSLTKVGAGTLTLTGTNTYNGGTTISAGTLALGASNVLANATAVSIGATTLSVGAGFTDTVGTLDVTGAATINLGSATSGLAFANSSAMDWTGGTLNITGTLGATALRFGTTSGGLTSGQLALISVDGSGAGTYTLDGSGYLCVIKNWDGSDSADWGTGANWSGDALPGDVELAAFTSTSPSGYDIYMGTAARTIKGIIFDSTTTANPYSINLQESSTVTTSRTLTVGTGGIIVNAGTHTIKGAKLGSGNVGPLLLTSAPFNIATNSTLTFDVRLRNSTTGQSYSKTGAGTLVLNADNGGSSGWISAGFTVSQGVLRFAAANAFGNSANTYSVSSGAALELTGGVSQGIGTTGTGTITLNGTGISSNGALRSLSGNNSLTSSGGTGGIILATDSTIGVDADTLSIGQVVSGGFKLTKVGAGTLSLSNTNSYDGTTTVSAGTLSLGHATNTLADTTAVSIGAATLSVGIACADTVGTLDVTGAATINLGDATSVLTFSNSSGVDWTGGTLTLTGSFVPGASIKFGLGGLTGTQLTKISATGWTSFGLDGSGFLTATPIGGGNVAPAISDITNPAPFPSGGNTGALAFTITDEDVNTVTPTGSSSNTTLVPNGNISFGGSGGNRTVTVTPVPGKSGSATITVTLTDNGSLTASDTFTVTVTDNYLSWATLNGVTGGPNGDSDNDGVKNLVEYALVDGGERGVLSGNTITFTKRGGVYGSDLTYDIESSTDLVGWGTLAKPPVAETSGSISYTFTPGSPVKNFARLNVTGP